MRSTGNRSIRGALAGAVVVVGAAFASHASAQLVTAYDADSALPLSGSTGVSHYAQQITLAGSGGSEIYGYSKLGLDWTNITAGTQEVKIDVYTGADTSVTATDALASATLIGSDTVALAPPSSTGGYYYSLSYGTPLAVATNTVTLVVSLENPDTSYSTSLSGIFSRGTPPVGSDLGFVWSDADHNGIFAGSEQTATIGGGSPSHIDVVVSVPEPTSMLVLAGLAPLALLRRRTRA